MGNIMVVVGSYRKGGNTDKLADAFIRGATEQGHSVTKVFLGEKKLEFCRGCMACAKTAWSWPGIAAVSAKREELRRLPILKRHTPLGKAYHSASVKKSRNLCRSSALGFVIAIPLGLFFLRISKGNDGEGSEVFRQFQHLAHGLHAIFVGRNPQHDPAQFESLQFKQDILCGDGAVDVGVLWHGKLLAGADDKGRFQEPVDFLLLHCPFLELANTGAGKDCIHVHASFASMPMTSAMTK